MEIQEVISLLKLQLDDSFFSLFELIPDICFFVKDSAGRLVYCNETHRQSIFRYGDAQDLYGKNNHDFFPNVLAAKFAKDDMQVINTGKPLIENIELNIASSGLLAWFCTTKIPRKCEGKDHWLVWHQSQTGICRLPARGISIAGPSNSAHPKKVL